MRVGFVGLGDQGQPMAQRILEGGHDLSVFARRPVQADPLVERGARRCTDLAELGERSDVLGICVGDDAQVLEVGGAVLPHLRDGAVVVVHSTVHPDTCVALAADAAPLSVHVVDAPVSGGRRRAFEGALTVMVGGDVDPVTRVEPVLRTFAALVLHVGPLGAGQLLKLVNNALFTAQVGLAGETERLLLALGLDVRQSLTALAASTGGSRCLQMYVDAEADHVFPRHQDGRARGAELLGKDIDLFDAVASARGVAVPPVLDTVLRHGLALARRSGDEELG